MLNFVHYGGQVIIEMTDGGVDRSVECTGNVRAMISAFECVHDVMPLKFNFSIIGIRGSFYTFVY